MVKDRPKILDECRISVMREGGTPAQLTPDEQRTLESLHLKDETAARAKAKAEAKKETARLLKEAKRKEEK